jgi:hypothetical protein
MYIPGAEQLFGSAIFIIALGIFIWEAVRRMLDEIKGFRKFNISQKYLNHPGPHTYDNHFLGMSLCILLAFTGFQLIIAKNSYIHRAKAKWEVEEQHIPAMNIYWLLLIVFTSVSIAYSTYLHKTDCIILTSLMLLSQLFGFVYFSVVYDKKSSALPSTGATDSTRDEILNLMGWFNRVWRAVHLTFTIAMMALLVVLRHTYKHENP